MNSKMLLTGVGMAVLIVASVVTVNPVVIAMTAVMGLLVWEENRCV